MKFALSLAGGWLLSFSAFAAPPGSIPANGRQASDPIPWDENPSIVLYSNITSPDPNGYYMSQQIAGAPFGDDLQMASGGLLDGFTFIYRDPDGGLHSAQRKSSSISTIRTIRLATPAANRPRLGWARTSSAASPVTGTGRSRST